MLELIQITNDPLLARRCEAMGGMRVFVDLERLGKAERQAGRNTFISPHTLDDIAPVKAALRDTPLMVRVDPLHEGTAAQVDAAIARGADLLMLPMWHDAATLREFARVVGGRRPIVPLVETPGAVDSLGDWIATPGLHEVFVGLNDLHLALGARFMFEPLAQGLVERVAQACGARGLRFGFGGIAQLEGGLLPGRDVLAEHVRLGSNSVILSRTFAAGDRPLEDAVAALRAAERELAARPAAQVDADRVRIAARVGEIAAALDSRLRGNDGAVRGNDGGVVIPAQAGIQTGPR